MLVCPSNGDAQHVKSHLEVRDHIVLGRLVVESVQQDLISIAFTDGIRNASDEAEQLIGKVFVKERFEAGLVQYVGQRSEASLFLVELAAVANVQKTFEVAERDRWDSVNSSAMLVGCSLTYHASRTCHLL